MRGLRFALGLPWFGPKTTFGWGWTPIAWQGWALTVGFGALTIAISVGCLGPHRTSACFLAVVVFVCLVAMTGTKPGGRMLD
jgi:hypothetical protein